MILFYYTVIYNVSFTYWTRFYRSMVVILSHQHTPHTYPSSHIPPPTMSPPPHTILPPSPYIPSVPPNPPDMRQSSLLLRLRRSFDWWRHNIGKHLHNLFVTSMVLELVEGSKQRQKKWWKLNIKYFTLPPWLPWKDSSQDVPRENVMQLTLTSSVCRSHIILDIVMLMNLEWKKLFIYSDDRKA